MTSLLDWLEDEKIPVGKTAKKIFDFLKDNFEGVFDAASVALETMIEGILWALQTPHPLIMVALFTGCAYLLQRSWKVALFTLAWLPLQLYDVLNQIFPEIN